jgi:hypothetical protein
MGTKLIVQQDTDTTLWGGVAMILVLASADVFIQAAIGILFPVVGWTLLYFIKREVTYRWPPKVPEDLFKQLLEKYSEERDKSKKELQ